MKTTRNLIRAGLLWAAMLPAVVQAQFTFTTNSDGSLNICSYSGYDVSLNIPASTNNRAVASIGQYAFFYCDSLNTVSIPASITSIAGQAFYQCTSLSAINVAADNPNYSSLGGVLFNQRQTTLLEFPQGCVLTSYPIPDGVTNIADYAFNSCPGLNNISLPTSLTGIGVSAFAGCTNLSSLTLPTNVATLNDFAFQDCVGLTSVTFPGGVTNIGNYALYDCSRLTNACFEGNAPLSVGTGAFNGDPLSAIYHVTDTSGWGT